LPGGTGDADLERYAARLADAMPSDADVVLGWASRQRPSYRWAVEQIPGTHLELMNRPDGVATAIECVVTAARTARKGAWS
jgi:hypothetical protein